VFTDIAPRLVALLEQHVESDANVKP